MQTETRIRSTLASVLAMLWAVLTAASAVPRQAFARRVDRRRDRPALTHWAPSAIGVVLGVNAIVGVAAAQSNSVCGTTIATGTQDAARFLVGLLVVGCIVTAALAEGYGRLKRDPKATADLKKWRNGAAVGTVSTPSIMWLVVQIAGFYNIPVVRCIDLVPFL